jgi:hypothetical protein
VLFEDLVDPPDLFLIARQEAAIARVQKIQEGDRGLRVLALRVLQLADHERPQLRSGGGVLALSFLERRHRLASRVAKRDVALGARGVLAPEPLDEPALALVVGLALGQTSRYAHRQGRDESQSE